MNLRRMFAFLLLGLFPMAVVGAQAIPNWSAPPFWGPLTSGANAVGSPDAAAQAMDRESAAVVTASSPFPFVALTPCRIVDTRGNGAPIQGGRFTANEIRTWAITGICGLPTSAVAVSLNITVTGTDSSPFGFVTVWPGGTPEPTASTLNWSSGGVTESNAAIVPLGTSPAGSIALQTGNAGADVLVDINGYYGGGVGSNNLFLGLNAGNFTMTGSQNTGIGTSALRSNTSANANTATGASALVSNTTGAVNTASGANALAINTVGNANTAMGTQALFQNTTGGSNTANGFDALFSNTTGNSNIALGVNSGSALTTGNFNIDIGSVGVAAESGTIRIGTTGSQTQAFLAGVRGVTTGAADGLAVLIDSNGQLGTISSSASVKREIADVGSASEALWKLRPVSFLYRGDTVGIRQYGLIAEEVAGVMPELVQFTPSGSAETVRYHFLVPLLLNEIQKEHATIRLLEERLVVLEGESRNRRRGDNQQ